MVNSCGNLAHHVVGTHSDAYFSGLMVQGKKRTASINGRAGFRVYSSGFVVYGQAQLLRSIEKHFQGGLVFKARRLLYHSTLGRE